MSRGIYHDFAIHFISNFIYSNFSTVIELIRVEEHGAPMQFKVKRRVIVIHDNMLRLPELGIGTAGGKIFRR